MDFRLGTRCMITYMRDKIMHYKANWETLNIIVIRTVTIHDYDAAKAISLELSENCRFLDFEEGL